MKSLLLLTTILSAILFSSSINGDNEPQLKKCDYSVPIEEIPTFKEVAINFNHQFDKEKSLPVTASCLIDIDNDGVDELFIGGGYNQQDAIFKYRVDSFENISTQCSLPEKSASTSIGAVSFDMNNDGYVDLLVARETGVFWYKNINGKFESTKLDILLDSKSNAGSFAIADINLDGYPDIFLCTYIKKELMEGQTIFLKENYGSNSVLLINNGDLTFKNTTIEAGLQYTHNTFQSVFVDVDNDGLIDLVVAYDTGEVRTYKNLDGKHFKLMTNPMTNKYGYPMGIAVGDYNNDGNIDFFFSNTGSSVPRLFAKGDLPNSDNLVTDWILFKNEGNFKFSNAAKSAGIADLEFSWGAVFQDFNLDGLQDLVVAENYIDYTPNKLFKLPCRFLLQRNNNTFAPVEEQASVVNKHYAITPLTSDFNNDGYSDLIYTNLNGPLRVFINKGGKGNHYIKIKFPETAAYSGTLVEVKTKSGKILSDVYVVGEGLASDQTNVLTLGLGKEKIVVEVIIHYPGGKKQIIINPNIDTTLFIQKER